MMASAPQNLPPEYMQIWEAVYQLDQAVSSRHVLARTLRVSTQTLHRILVSGEVPDFNQNPGNRVRNGWIRTLTRLATAVGKEPREWIEAVQIPWDEEVAAISKTAGAVSENVTPNTSGLHREPLVIGILDTAPFSKRFSNSAGSFLEGFTRSLMGSMYPGRTIRFIPMSLPDRGELFSENVSELHAVSGVTFTGRWIRDAACSVVIPGLRTQLNALIIHPTGSDIPTFWDAVTETSRRMCIVRQGNPAHDFLLGQCGWSRENLIVRNPVEIMELTDIFREEALKDPSQQRILVCDNFTCGAVKSILETSHALPTGFAVSVTAAKGTELPAYPVGIVFNSDDLQGDARVAAVVDTELFGAGGPRTARLYRELIHRVTCDLLSPSAPRKQLLTDIFRYCRWTDFNPDFLKQLEGEMDSSHQSLFLGDIIPENRTVSLSDSVAVPRCRSCMEPLDRNHINARTTHYCRYCADEDGSLKPRSDVQSLIAGWLVSVQGSMPEEEAMKRADLYMQAMPAWQQRS